MKKALSVLLSLLMIISSFMLVPFSAYADDTRTVVTAIEATSNWKTVATYGNAVASPEFTVTSEQNVWFNVGMGHWIDNSTGSNITTVFDEGTVYYYLQIRIDNTHGTDNTLYKLSDTTTITVNGETWTNLGCNVYDDFSYLNAKSPTLLIEKTTIPLSFADNAKYDIGRCFRDSAISPVSVADGVIGGNEPYTFSKTSGPEWLTVSADGTLSGTPTSVSAATTAVIRVTDADTNYQEITINIGKTILSPADREAVNEITATSTIESVLVYGADVTNPTFTISAGDPVVVSNVMGSWYETTSGTPVKKTSGTFGHGTYYYITQIRIDNYPEHLSADSFVIGNPASVKVDGADWTVSEYKNDGLKDTESYSMAYIQSPTFTLHNPTPIKAVEPKCEVEGNNAYYYCDGCGKYFKDAACTVETTPDDELIAPLPHSWDEGTVKTAPTCTETGVKTLKCTRVGCTKTSDVTIPALGHDMYIDEVGVAATCTQAGNLPYCYCKRCKNYYIDTEGKEQIDGKPVIAATGHKWDEGKVTTPATTDAAGVKTYTCTVCNATRTEEISKIPAPAAPTESAKKKNTLKVKQVKKTVTVKYKKLKKKAQTIKLDKYLKVTKAKGTVSYKKTSGNKKITVNKKTGKITVKKGLKKGTYKVKIKVTAKGTAKYKKGSKTITVKIKVK